MAESFVTLCDDAVLKSLAVAKQLGINTTPSGSDGLTALIRDLDNDNLILFQ